MLSKDAKINGVQDLSKAITHLKEECTAHLVETTKNLIFFAPIIQHLITAIAVFEYKSFPSSTPTT